MQSYINKNTWSCLLCAMVLAVTACNSGKKTPDVSHIPMNVKTARFDTALFNIDTNNVAPGLHKLAEEYPVFFPVYIEHIMNFGPYTDSNRLIPEQTRMFLTNPDFKALQHSVAEKYPSLDKVEQELAQTFRYIKYYIPAFHPPKVVSFISGIGNYGAVTADTILGIGLDMYMGTDFPPYGMIPDFPAYMVRRFTPEYITTNCAQVIQQELFPPSAKANKLIEQMVEAGKQQYFLDLVLPQTPDTIKLGYTKDQLDWCYDNEQMIWQYFIQNNLLYSTDWQDITYYLGDGPATRGMPPGSPGKIGSFVGWQIVKHYMDRHPEVTLQQLMGTNDLLKIFNEAKYKPR
jgi:gliding motility-associated lipoprotein GldB